VVSEFGFVNHRGSGFPEPKKIEVPTARLKQRNLLPDESLIIKKVLHNWQNIPAALIVQGTIQ
jgi:hypothetical protein